MTCAAAGVDAPSISKLKSYMSQPQPLSHNSSLFEQIKVRSNALHNNT